MAPPRQSPYRRVEVRGLVWEGHDHHRQQGLVRNANQELCMVMDAFDDYGYATSVTPIPMNPRQRSGFPSFLQHKLVDLAHRSSATLIILYYQGHGGLDRDGHLVLSNGNGQSMHWSEVANAIVNAPCDVLAVLNCCHAGAAVRYRVPPSRANYEQHIKQVMMAVPAGYSTGWGYASGFAACLEQALRDRRTNWESSFQGRPDHWAEAITRVLDMKPGRNHQVGVRHLVPPPSNFNQRPIVLGPRWQC